MIPLSLMTGFLGSGKTTLMQRMVDRYQGSAIAYIVNDCGDVSIDGRRINPEAGQLIEIPGGSIFCRCLAGEFIHHIESLVSQADKGAGVEGMLIEASGISDPKVLPTLLEETQLNRKVSLQSMICLVAPQTFNKLVHTLPHVVSQVESAQHIVINKTDLCDRDEVNRALEQIKALNRHASIEQTTFARTDWQPFEQKSIRQLPAALAPCADPHFVRTTLHIDHPVAFAQLEKAIAAVEQHVFRIKGQIPTTEGMKAVEVADGTCGLTDIQTSSTEGILLIVAAADQLAAITQFSKVLGLA